MPETMRMERRRSGSGLASAANAIPASMMAENRWMT